MSTLLLTTDSVDDFPTSTEPPSAVYPKNDDTLAMMKAKNKLLMILIQTNHSLNEWRIPSVRSSGDMICPTYAVAYAPTTPIADEKMTRKGIMVTNPIIFGRIR